MPSTIKNLPIPCVQIKDKAKDKTMPSTIEMQLIPCMIRVISAP